MAACLLILVGDWGSWEVQTQLGWVRMAIYPLRIILTREMNLKLNTESLPNWPLLFQTYVVVLDDTGLTLLQHQGRWRSPRAGTSRGLTYSRPNGYKMMVFNFLEGNESFGWCPWDCGVKLHLSSWDCSFPGPFLYLVKAQTSNINGFSGPHVSKGELPHFCYAYCYCLGDQICVCLWMTCKTSINY